MWCIRGLGLALGLVCLAWAQSGVAHAQRDPVVADLYQVDVTVEEGAALAVVERLALDVSGRTLQHGSLRISMARVEAIREVRVAEPDRLYQRGQDEPYTYSSSPDGDFLRIDWWFPPTVNARREFVISYRAEGALRVHPAGDQVYWQAIGADRGYAVRQARALVHLPAPVAADQLQWAAYPEHLDVAIRQADPRTVVFETTNLAPRTGLVARVQFPHGLVAAQPPRWQAEADRADWLTQTARPAVNFLMVLLGLLIPAAGLVGLGILWGTRGSDPRVADGAPVLTTPPSDLPAPLVGTLLDQHADAQDVVATLVDLANRGVVEIAELEDPTLVGSSRDYELVRRGQDEADLREHERLLLLTLFGTEDRARLSRVRDTFAAAIPAMQAALHREVARAGLFVEDPEAVRKRYTGLGWTLVILAVIGGIVLGGWLATYSDLVLLPFSGVVVLGVGLVWLARHMPRRTRAGALAAERWAAFRAHLAQLAGGREPAQREEFERYLPYATAFGLDRAWIERFAAVGAPAPTWYHGGTNGPVIIATPGWGGRYGGGVGVPGGWGGPGPTYSGGQQPADFGGTSAPPPSYYGPGGLQGMSGSLSDMLNRASDVFAHGGGSDWSGGGFGDFGGSSGGGGGGGSSFD
jgi:hypothetical protein